MPTLTSERLQAFSYEWIRTAPIYPATDWINVTCNITTPLLEPHHQRPSGRQYSDYDLIFKYVHNLRNRRTPLGNTID